jgi:4-amino-4-deoxy-L-arabinose transferase-like glycosyltransferase
MADYKTYMNLLRTNKNIVLIVLFGIILFFVNIKDSHDWGGDFAMYISQAKNIAEGAPMGNTHYIFNEDYPVLGPPAYPVGFPLLLAPVYAICGNSIKAFTLFITVILFLFGLMLVLFYKEYFTGFIPFFLAMVILFNPWTLMFKLEVMSDIPFAFFLLMGVILFIKGKRKGYAYLLLLGLISGYIISIRTIGIAFALAILVFSVLEALRLRQRRQLLEGLVVFLLAILVNFLLNSVIFPLPAEGGISYLKIFGTEPIWKTITGNLSYYFDALMYFFNPFTHNWKWAAVLMHSMAIAFTVLGFINHLARRIRFVDILVIFYFATIIIYPYRHAGFRFLLPILPYLLYYMVQGMNSFKFKFKMNKDLKVVAIGVMALSLYMNSLLYMFSQRNKILEGPQESYSSEVFEYIRNNTAPGAKLAFFKPRVLGLYTSRPSFAVSPGQNQDVIRYQLNKAGIDYILIHKGYSDQSMIDYVNKNQDSITLIWDNEKFRFYERMH